MSHMWIFCSSILGKLPDDINNNSKNYSFFDVIKEFDYISSNIDNSDYFWFRLFVSIQEFYGSLYSSKMFNKDDKDIELHIPSNINSFLSGDGFELISISNRIKSGSEKDIALWIKFLDIVKTDNQHLKLFLYSDHMIRIMTNSNTDGLDKIQYSFNKIIEESNIINSDIFALINENKKDMSVSNIHKYLFYFYKSKYDFSDNPEDRCLFYLFALFYLNRSVIDFPSDKKEGSEYLSDVIFNFSQNEDRVLNLIDISKYQ